MDARVPVPSPHRYAGPIGVRINGNLLSHDQGTATAYALDKASARGAFFSKPGHGGGVSLEGWVGAPPALLLPEPCP